MPCSLDVVSIKDIIYTRTIRVYWIIVCSNYLSMMHEKRNILQYESKERYSYNSSRIFLKAETSGLFRRKEKLPFLGLENDSTLFFLTPPCGLEPSVGSTRTPPCGLEPSVGSGIVGCETSRGSLLRAQGR